jgi:hypothetical protein
MATKVGASLWNPMADQQRTPVRETQDRDFERKIGLRDRSTMSDKKPAHESGEPALPGQRSLNAGFLQAEAGRTPRMESSETSPSKSGGALELYALGAHAGRHLSFLPDMFLEEHGISDVASVGHGYGSSTTMDSLPIAAAISLLPSALLINPPGAQVAEPVRIEQQETDISVSRQLLGYFGGRWPDRHFQFLPRGKGLELLVRDYQLTPQERDELIGELSRRASSMPERPQQIWLNGEEVWRASSRSIDYKGEQNGG